MQPGTYSPDGRWWWDGQVWRAVEPRPPTGPPGLFWFFRTPGWAGPLFLNGLILLLPIVGLMVVLGWYLAVRDNLRRGWLMVPPASFDYLERGARPWVVNFLYYLCAGFVLLLLLVGLVVAIRVQSPVAIAVLVFLLIAYYIVRFIVLGFLAAAIYDLADAGGIGVAAHPGRLWAAATADASSSWRVFGAFLLGGLIILGAALVTLPVLIFVPFGGLVLLLFMPGVYLMAAPAQASFTGTSAVRSTAPGLVTP